MMAESNSSSSSNNNDDDVDRMSTLTKNVIQLMKEKYNIPSNIYYIDTNKINRVKLYEDIIVRIRCHRKLSPYPDNFQLEIQNLNANIVKRHRLISSLISAKQIDIENNLNAQKNERNLSKLKKELERLFDKGVMEEHELLK